MQNADQVQCGCTSKFNYVSVFSSADFADFKEFFNDVVKDVTIKQNLNAISGSISKDTNEAFHCCFDTRFLKKLAFCIVGQNIINSGENEILIQIYFAVFIDGIEWTGVKFFQLSSQWQTHIKSFPVAGVSSVQTSLQSLEKNEEIGDT